MQNKVIKPIILIGFWILASVGLLSMEHMFYNLNKENIILTIIVVGIILILICIFGNKICKEQQRKIINTLPLIVLILLVIGFGLVAFYIIKKQ